MKFILIMTMCSYAGYGAIESVETNSLESCNAIGSAWVADAQSKRSLSNKEIFYTCQSSNK